LELSEIRARVNSLSTAIEEEVGDAIGDHERMERIASTHLPNVAALEGELVSGRFSPEEATPLHEQIDAIKALLNSAPPAAEEAPLTREGVVFARFNQSHFTALAGYGGPCTYCSLQFITESLMTPEQKTQFRIPQKDDPREELGAMTARGAKTYLGKGNEGTVAFAEAYDKGYRKILDNLSEHAFRPDIDGEEQMWQKAVDALDAAGNDVGAVLTINGAHFHTYGLVKKEGVFIFYDSHGESDYGEKETPAYTRAFATKEEVVAYLNRIRKIADGPFVYVEQIDVSVVKLKRRG